MYQKPFIIVKFGLHLFLAKRQESRLYKYPKIQTKLQETYYTILKYKNEMIFVPSFVFIGLFLRPRCFRKEK